MWAPLSNWTQEAIDTMHIAGYYVMQIQPGLKVMAINSNYGWVFSQFPIQIKKIPEAVKGLGVCYHKLQNFAAGRDHLTDYLLINPNDHQVRFLLVDVHESMQNYQKAVKIIEDTPQTVSPS